MKIKKYNENNYLHNTDEGLEHYTEWFNNFLSKYIDENDISHSELLKSNTTDWRYMTNATTFFFQILHMAYL